MQWSKWIAGLAWFGVVLCAVPGQAPVQVSAVGPVCAPQVAYDATHDVYLVVWDEMVAVGKAEVLAQRVDGSTGQLRGDLIKVQSGLPGVQRPDVANVNSSDTFVVVWEENGAILAAGVDAGSAAVSLPITVADNEPARSAPSVGGDASLGGSEAFVVWMSGDQTGTFDYALLDVSEPGTIVGQATGTFGVASGVQPCFFPDVSKDGGPEGRWGVVWARAGRAGSEVDFAVWERGTGQGIVEPMFTPGWGDEAPRVDGNGKHWTVAWTRTDPVSLTGSVLARDGWLDAAGGICAERPERIIGSSPLDPGTPPAVARLGGSSLVGYADQGREIQVSSLDPYGCTPCTGGWSVPPIYGAPNERRLEMAASHTSSGGTGVAALLVWIDGAQSFGAVTAQLVSIDDGAVTDLGGGCGRGGLPDASCAVAGNSSFALRSFDVPPAAASFALLSARRIDVACGVCTLVPDPFSGFALQGATTSCGEASVAFALPASPSVVGVAFFAQWLVTGGQGCVGLDLSNALQVEIQ